MTHPLRYRSDEIIVLPSEPFKNDKLGREPFVTEFSDLLKAIREPFVVALNAPWGTGKSTTLRMLESKLAADGMVTASFNSWEVDDATDPLVPLVAALHDRILQIKGYGENVDQEKIARWKKLGSAIAKHGAIAAVKVATAGLLDMQAASDGLAKAVTDAADKTGEALTEDVIDTFKQEQKAAQQFRALLAELTAYVRVTAEEGASPPPLVLVIDELDRCRPTFAVAMLERIKHFFSVPGLVFVLALDLEQLKASTRKVYGAELDATEYLRRFVDLELRLPRAGVAHMIDAMLMNCGADAFFEQRASYQELREDRKWIVSILASLAHSFDLSPRMVQRMVSRLMLVIRQTPIDHFLDPILAVFMIFLRSRRDSLYDDLLSGCPASALMQTLCGNSARGTVFFNSHPCLVIEAHIMFAHKERHEYVRDALARAKQHNESEQDALSERARQVAGRYDSVSSTYFRRGYIDLKAIATKIDLVTEDLVDQR